MKLPKEPRLELVAAALDLDSRQETTQIETVFQFQRADGLQLYIPKGFEICCQLASAGFEEAGDPDGPTTFLSCGATHHFHTTTNLVQLGSCTLNPDYNVLVSSVFIEGTEYILLDETGMYLTPLQLRPADVFALRNELDTFIKRDLCDIPSYADPNSEHYAPELALALELHQKIRVERQLHKGNTEDAVDLWLRKNRPDLNLSAASKERISRIINKNTLTLKRP